MIGACPAGLRGLGWELTRRWRLKKEAYLFRSSSWGIKDQLRFWATPNLGAGSCPSTNSPRSGQGRDKEGKPGRVLSQGQDCFHVM